MILSGKKQKISPLICSAIIDSAMNEMEQDRSSHNSLSFPGSTSSKTDESPLLSFVLPLFKCLRLIFLAHSRYEFEKVKGEGEFRHYPGSTLRKIICGMVQLTTLLYLFMESKYLMALTGSMPITVMYKLMSIAYLFFNITFFWALMTKGDTFVEIFNYIQNATIVVRKAGCKIPRKHIVRWIAISMIGFYCFHAIFFVIVNSDGMNGASMGYGFTFYMRKVVDYNVHRFQVSFYSKNISEASSSFSENNPMSLVVLVGIINWWASLLAALSWATGFLMITLWGLLFWKVMFNFFGVISKSSVRNTLEDIRSFNAITGVVDLFNRAFSWVIFSGVMSGIAHFSVFSVEMFSDDGNISSKIIILISFVCFGSMLVASAQVNQSATNIVETIKLRYQMQPVWREYHGNCIETTQGLVLIFHETQTNKIGFRGLGFFTVTYSFIGTVLSIISTYAVVVMQLSS